MYNRRRSARVGRHCAVAYNFQGRPGLGVTLNVSETGARVLLRHPAEQSLQMTLDLDGDLRVQTETVWEEPLSGGSRIRGVRFRMNSRQASVLKRWVARHT